MASLTSAGVARAAPPQRQPLDALAEVFVHLGRLANVNTNQILIVSGRLDPALLEQAVRRAVGQIPLLRSLPLARRPELQEPVVGLAQRFVTWRQHAGDCHLADPYLRRLLMDFSDEHRLDWRARTPLQLLLVTGRDGRSSCVYLNTHHGVADARSDFLLLRLIIDHYAQLSGVPGAVASRQVLSFTPLAQFRPQWGRLTTKVGRWWRAGLSIAADLVQRDIGLQRPLRGPRWEGRSADPAIGRLDFYHGMVPPLTATRLAAAARAVGVTVNTLWCAALARALERSAAGRRGMLRITCAVSLRRLLDARYDRSFRNYLVPSNVRIPTGQSSGELLRCVHQAVEAARTDTRVSTEIGRLEALQLVLRRPALNGLARTLLNLCQGTNACYSNPGRIEEDFSNFGSTAHRTLQYIGFGCLVPPYDFILYTPTVNGRMQIDVVYRCAAFPDIRQDLVTPLLAALDRLLDDIESVDQGVTP
ncbi:hypothetical protein [Caldimonas brevitalea]|uniref:Condensation domain-containing protein n=1 Tax=Caldimonas brevitalea TaxID=413882 RepID=A0A0G3BC54_9BURK|nr:hypothetical protein [Caldimonas brevitalea]AKJ26892.1 hypothetical protein AAW51_0201 [Caldimonas brevitalea]